jgi:hypothetical protein
VFHARKQISSVIYSVFQNDKERVYAMLCYSALDPTVKNMLYNKDENMNSRQ